jgi:hypothetical protein
MSNVRQITVSRQVKKRIPDEFYTHEKFMQDYQEYQRRTGKTIRDLDCDYRQYFVSWCERCGKDVTRLNIWYSVFAGIEDKPLCYQCQKRVDIAGVGSFP